MLLRQFLPRRSKPTLAHTDVSLQRSTTRSEFAKEGQAIAEKLLLFGRDDLRSRSSPISGVSAIDRRVSDFLLDEGVHIVSQASTHKQEDEYDLREKVETKENEEKVRES